MFDNIPGSFTESVLCSISEPAIIFNSDFFVVWTNPSTEMYFNHSNEYMVGRECTDLFYGLKECREACPVRKAFISGKPEMLVVEDIDHPHKLIEAIPYTGSDNRKFILSIIHSAPEVDRNKALRRDFAARLNLSANLAEASMDIVNTIENLTTVPAVGLYVKASTGFRLLHGRKVPDTILFELEAVDFSTPLYLPVTRLPFHSGDFFADGAAIVPVTSPDGEVNVLLLSGNANMSTRSRNRLEMVAEVLGSCVERLTSSGA